MADWKTFLDTVDAEETDPDVLKEAEAFLMTAKLKNPQGAMGISLKQLEGHANFPVELPTQAFLSRAMDALAAVAAARRAAKEIVPAASASSPQTVGSALNVAALLSPPKTVDVNSLLKNCQLDALPFNLQVDQSVADKMAAETETARKAQRKPFLFIDLTLAGTLPLWLAPESVGGKIEDDFEELDGGTAISSLAQLGQALKGATETKRFFPSIHQWTAAFMRYAPFAVACEHLDWTLVLTHLNTILKLVEEEKCDGRGPQLAMLYDELLRRQLERRAQKADPTLDLPTILAEADKSILAAARQRLDSVLKAAGRGKSSGSGGAGAAAKALAYSHKEAAIAAAKALNEQQAERLEAAGAAGADRSGGGGKGKGPSRPMGKRKAKKVQWIKDKKAEWKGNKRYRNDGW
jgi:hypothetical protein